MNIICPLKPGDIDSVVEVHLSSFTGFFLSLMGASFLKEFYKAVLLDEATIALASQQEDVVSGFVVGSIQPRGFYRRAICKNWHRFLLASVNPVLKRPQLVMRLMRRLVTTGGTDDEANEALLMSIAVSPSRQGEGIGKRLVEAFLVEARQRGAKSVSLTTDELDNAKVNHFYVRAGFTYARSFITSEGRQMNEYRMCLS